MDWGIIYAAVSAVGTLLTGIAAMWASFVQFRKYNYNKAKDIETRKNEIRERERQQGFKFQTGDFVAVIDGVLEKHEKPMSVFTGEVTRIHNNHLIDKRHPNENYYTISDGRGRSGTYKENELVLLGH